MEILIIIFLLFVLNGIKTLLAPNLKGKLGETIVSIKLNNLPFENYKTLNDVIIKNNQYSSQIDHIVICDYGIIVIETKFYKGWIFGSESGSNWTQVIYKKKFKIINPIIQNKGHIIALKNNLPKYSQVPFHQIVVLAGPGEFKSFDEVETSVIYPSDLYETLKEFKSEQVLSQTDIHDIYELLINISSKDTKSKIDHIEKIKNKLSVAQTTINNGQCPRCYGKLVSRTGKFGSFLGCANYPRCRFTT